MSDEKQDPLNDDSNCYTLPDGTCVASGECVHIAMRDLIRALEAGGRPTTTVVDAIITLTSPKTHRHSVMVDGRADNSVDVGTREAMVSNCEGIISSLPPEPKQGPSDTWEFLGAPS